MPVIIVVILTFLLCWLADKGFSKFFRSKPQHVSGKAVRLGKFYSLGGLILCVLGVVAILTGISASVLLLIGGIVVLLTGIFLVVYYLSFGVFYDSESFVASGFGKKSITCRYGQIRNQQLFNNRGQLLIELYLEDGSSLQIQSGMANALDFMNTAFSGWCVQRGIDRETCKFHDPENCRWFPPLED